MIMENQRESEGIANAKQRARKDLVEMMNHIAALCTFILNYKVQSPWIRKTRSSGKKD